MHFLATIALLHSKYPALSLKKWPIRIQWVTDGCMTHSPCCLQAKVDNMGLLLFIHNLFSCSVWNQLSLFRWKGLHICNKQVFILREASFKGYHKYYHAYTEEDFTRIDDFMIEEMQRQNGQNSLILGNQFSSTNCHIYPRVVVTLSIYLCLRG